VFGFGLGIAVAPLTATAMSTAPAQHSGIASAVNNRSKLLRRHNPVGRQADQSICVHHGRDILRQSAAQIGGYC
jgi:hypothetical protein